MGNHSSCSLEKTSSRAREKPSRSQAKRWEIEDEIDELLNRYMESRQPRHEIRKDILTRTKVGRRKKKQVPYVGTPVVPVERQAVRFTSAGDNTEEGEDWMLVSVITQKVRFELPDDTPAPSA